MKSLLRVCGFLAVLAVVAPPGMGGGVDISITIDEDTRECASDSYWFDYQDPEGRFSYTESGSWSECTQHRDNAVVRAGDDTGPLMSAGSAGDGADRSSQRASSFRSYGSDGYRSWDQSSWYTEEHQDGATTDRVGASTTLGDAALARRCSESSTNVYSGFSSDSSGGGYSDGADEDSWRRASNDECFLGAEAAHAGRSTEAGWVWGCHESSSVTFSGSWSDGWDSQHYS